MAYFHGAKASEIDTSVLATVSTTAGLPVVFGTAPVNTTENPSAYVNKPVICYNWSEAVKALGYSDDWDSFTLCEAMYAAFKLYNISPIIFVNVLDPSKHTKAVSNETHAVAADKTVTLTGPVVLSTLTVKGSENEAAQDLKKDTDYTAAFNDDGQVVITLLPTGSAASSESIMVSYSALDASKVGSNDIIGGASAEGKVTGLELLDTIYSRFSFVPGMVLAPGYSENPAVASVMKSKAHNIDSIFRCIALTDVDTAEAKDYQSVNEWKNKNNYTGTNQVVCWPCVRNGNSVFHMSTHIMGIIGVMDAANDDVPYQSPSNRSLQATGICLKDGTEVDMGLSQANLLNSQGVMTALNFSGGWKSWGNYTGAYPSITDVKDSFICVRRMFDWQYQTFILNYWQKVDQPLGKRLIKTIVDSEQIRLNGLVARGYMLGASVKFLEEENPQTDLLAGIVRIHTSITPPVPAQDIEDIVEYDVSNFNTLFN